MKMIVDCSATVVTKMEIHTLSDLSEPRRLICVNHFVLLV